MQYWTAYSVIETKTISIMATATITYDGRNKLARSVMDFIRSLDVFTVTEAPKRKSGIEQAFEDVAEGHVYHATDGADLIRQCLAD